MSASDNLFTVGVLVPEFTLSVKLNEVCLFHVLLDTSQRLASHTTQRTYIGISFRRAIAVISSGTLIWSGLIPDSSFKVVPHTQVTTNVQFLLFYIGIRFLQKRLEDFLIEDLRVHYFYSTNLTGIG